MDFPFLYRFLPHLPVSLESAGKLLAPILCSESTSEGTQDKMELPSGNFLDPVAFHISVIVKEMTGRNRAAQLEIVKQMSRQ